MPFNAELADRIRAQFKAKRTPVEEKKMMGGLTFMVNDKMCVGIMNDELLCRIDPEERAATLRRKAVRQMEFGGKTMTGFVLVARAGWNKNADLEGWIDQCLAYNPKAKASKKRKPQS